MWRKFATFLVYESAGAGLMWTAYLLPRHPGPTIPVILLLGGMVTCFTGLSYGIGSIPGMRALSFHHWTGRVSAPTWGKEVPGWVVTVRNERDHGAGGAGGG
jgi:hypothetical protein